MNRVLLGCAALVAGSGLFQPFAANAQACEAYFSFDGTLANASDGPDGRMIGPNGAAAAPRFVAGRVGQALELDGTAAMRAFVDLHFDVCPQVTFSAWIKVEGVGPRARQQLVSTGNGHGPGLYIAASHLTLNGPANGLIQRNAVREDEGWMFVAGVYDYAADSYTLYWRERRLSGTIGPSRRPPEEALWVGALNDRLREAAAGIAIDELRIQGRALSDEEIRALRTGAAAIGETEKNLRDVLPDDGTDRGETSGASPALLEVPEGLGAASGPLDPQLSMPGGLPAQELEEAVEAAQNAPPPVPGSAAYDLEVYDRDATGPVRTIDIVLPGQSERETITYQEVDGVAVAEGDIVLGTLDELRDWENAIADEVAAAGGLQTRRQGLNVTTNTKFLWPGGVIPYTFHANMTTAAQQLVRGAAKELNDKTNLTVRLRAGDTTYVEFKMKDRDSDACSSRIGMKQSSGSQTIKVDPSCGESTLMHELLHAAGFWHEQSRPDRDRYVEVLRDNVVFGKGHNFERKSSSSAAGVGPYNYRSIMHYDEFLFGKECIPIGVSDPNCLVLGPGRTVSRTLRALQPGAVIERDFSTDIAAINTIYPARIGPVSGLEWGGTHYATAVAIGDVDGDGRGEIVVGRFANDNSRFVVLDDSSAQHRIIATGPADWGAGIGVTDLALGDVDGDGRMEIGVTRNAGGNNRYFVYRFENGNLRLLLAGGSEWGAGNYATAIAFGDADGDGRDELAVGRRADDAGRYYLFDDAAAAEPFRRLAIGGSEWGRGHYTTDLAFGDVDGDGRAELGVTRNASSGQRYEVVGLASGGLTQRHSGGSDWGASYYGTAIAFGNIDADAADEVVVGRAADDNSRFYVLDDQRAGFALIETGGDLWGRGYHVVGAALADVDADGRDEIAIARNAGENGRYYVFDDRGAGFRPVQIVGQPLIDGVGATHIAAGDVDANGKADVVVTFDEQTQGRPRYEIFYMNPPSQ